MSLSEMNLFNVAKKQYFYKLKSNIGIFRMMAVLQIIALLMSFRGVGMSSSGGDGMMVSIQYISADILLVFTFIWAFTIALSFTTQASKNMDFAFVSSRASSHLSNIGFLLTTALLGGITAILGGTLLKNIIFFTGGTVLEQTWFIPPGEMMTGLIAAVLYIILIGSIGYFIGTLAQLHKAYILLLPALLLGTLFIENVVSHNAQIFMKTIRFFVEERSLGLFFIKVVVTGIVLYGSAIGLTNRMEVRT